MIRAAKSVITTGKRSQGASTITMQVARNFFLIRKKNLFPKN
ncbi:transglycosylase domain-containing protein [Candidatus Coxiella mudrowiae]